MIHCHTSTVLQHGLHAFLRTSSANDNCTELLRYLTARYADLNTPLSSAQ